MSLRNPNKPRPSQSIQPALTAAPSSGAATARDAAVPKDLTNETVRDLRIIFAAYEDPVSCTITISQVKQILQLMDGGPHDALGLERRLASHSIGERLNFKNFLTFFISQTQLQSQTMLVNPKEIFRYIDADDSGELTCEELREALCKMGMNLSVDESIAMFHAVESGVEGLISYHDFKKVYKLVEEQQRSEAEQEEPTGKNENRTKINRILRVTSKYRSSPRNFMSSNGNNNNPIRLTSLFVQDKK